MKYNLEEIDEDGNVKVYEEIKYKGWLIGFWLRRAIEMRMYSDSDGKNFIVTISVSRIWNIFGKKRNVMFAERTNEEAWEMFNMSPDQLSNFLDEVRKSISQTSKEEK